MMNEEGLTQKEIGEKIGWSENQIRKYSMLMNKLVPKLIDLVKNYQEGRGTEKVPMVTFNFTERWFRDSGLYDLNEKHKKRDLFFNPFPYI